MAVTENDIAWFVHLARRLREDTYGTKVWDDHGTQIIFARELVGMHFATAVELVLAHAQDKDAKTPKSITRNFKPEPGEPIEARRLRTKENTCDGCGHWRGSCICHLDDLPNYNTGVELPAWEPGDPEKAKRLRELAGVDPAAKEGDA